MATANPARREHEAAPRRASARRRSRTDTTVQTAGAARERSEHQLIRAMIVRTMRTLKDINLARGLQQRGKKIGLHEIEWRGHQTRLRNRDDVEAPLARPAGARLNMSRRRRLARLRSTAPPCGEATIPSRSTAPPFGLPTSVRNDSRRGGRRRRQPGTRGADAAAARTELGSHVRAGTGV
jgi:hypothetical protein